MEPERLFPIEGGRVPGGSRKASARPAAVRTLIIGSSGGGAHRSAAEALSERFAAGGQVVGQVDLLIDWLGPAGRLFASLWNRGMRHGSSRTLAWLLRLQRLCDLVFYVPVFLAASRRMRRQRINRVLDCQPLGTRAILHAARHVGRGRGAAVQVTKVLTEPTHRRLPQYFHPILRLPGRLRRELRLWASPPLLEGDESSQSFWLEHCGLAVAQVDGTLGFPVRSAFLRDSAVASLVIRLSEEEAARAQGVAGLRRSGPGTWTVDFPERARVVAIVMGSQGTRAFTRESVRRILERIDDPDLLLIVYAADARLRGQLWEIARSIGSRSRMLAMPFQDAETLAAIYRRSDVTLTRSGGMTCMELLASARGPALVCSGRSQAGPFHGMVEHEYGNFLYLARFHPAGARLVDTQNVADRLVAALRPAVDVARGTLARGAVLS